MDSSGYFDQSVNNSLGNIITPGNNPGSRLFRRESSNINNNNNNTTHNESNLSSMNALASSLYQLHHELQLQDEISQEELIDSITSGLTADNVQYLEDISSGQNTTVDVEQETMGSGAASGLNQSDQPSLEQIQRVYYSKGLEELESLQLLDLSPLANWKLSSYKQGYGLPQLRDDSPDTYWQSDGSNGSNQNNSAIMNNELCNPHSITIQFSKKVSLERISIFTNYSLDESYTPSKIKILAGSSDGWDLNEVCTVNFSKPIGWSHIIFNGIRSDGVLKCFVVKLIVLANHQDGKDSHIRAIRCFGKKSSNSNRFTLERSPPQSENIHSFSSHQSEFLKDLSLQSGLTTASGILLNNRSVRNISDRLTFAYSEEENDENEKMNSEEDNGTARILHNVADVIGFNSGYQSLELKTFSSIR